MKKIAILTVLHYPHCLRKFFRSYLGNIDLAEQIMGHAGYLTVYRDKKKEDIGKEFLKYAKNITIFESSPDLTETHKEMEEIKQENKELKQEMDRIRMELLEVKMKQVQELQKKKL